MSLVIRLSVVGRRGERKYRIVVKEKRSKRDGRPLEILGHYEKRLDGVNKVIKKDRVDYWISKGALPTKSVKAIL